MLQSSVLDVNTYINIMKGRLINEKNPYVYYLTSFVYYLTSFVYYLTSFVYYLTSFVC